MPYDAIRTSITADVANGGTFTVGYLANRDPGDYAGGFEHEVQTTLAGVLSIRNGRASFSFGASTVTITNNSGLTLPAGTAIVVQLDRLGGEILPPAARMANPGKMGRLRPVAINLGAPDAAAANNIGASQGVTGGVAGLVNGALATAGVATLDVPRNVVAAWTNTSILTVTGFDEYGVAMSEVSASGTTFAGKKAFKRVTGFTFSATVTGATVGTGDVFGLPVFLPQAGNVVREMQDGANATAGTLVAGVSTKATTTTGDVRGTYDPNAAADGARAFQLIAMLPDPAYRGVTQA
jgi:hypothetical protein